MLTERCTRAPSRTGCEMVRAATSGRRRARTTTGDGRGVSRTGTGSCPSPQARCTKGPTLTAYGTDSALSSTGRAAPSPASGATTSGAARGGGFGTSGVKGSGAIPGGSSAAAAAAAAARRGEGSGGGSGGGTASGASPTAAQDRALSIGHRRTLAFASATLQMGMNWDGDSNRPRSSDFSAPENGPLDTGKQAYFLFSVQLSLFDRTRARFEVDSGSWSPPRH